MKKIKLDELRIDGGTQSRVVIDQPTVYNYLEHMKEGDEFPKMFAFFDGATYWLVDGFHRYHAYKLLGIKEIEIAYKPGTLEEAQIYSYGVNATHGKPRTHEDKRKAVEGALAHPSLINKSDREIAKICHVSAPFVGSVRNPKVKEQQNKNREKSNAKKVAEKVEAGCNPITPAENLSSPPGVDPNAGEVPDESELRAAELALQADQDMMYKLLESDDALKTAHEEIKRLNYLNAQLEVRMNGLLAEKNEAVKMVKKLQKELDKLKGKK